MVVRGGVTGGTEIQALSLTNGINRDTMKALFFWEKSMFDESKHPRDEIGRFTTSDGMGGTHEATPAERERLKAYGIQDTISLPDETLPRSLSARWANEDIRMPDGTIAHFVEGSKLHHKEVFAGKGTKTTIRDVERLVKTYGGKAENWQKIKAIGTIIDKDGQEREAEIHWYEEDKVGRKDIKFKGWKHEG